MLQNYWNLDTTYVDSVSSLELIPVNAVTLGATFGENGYLKCTKSFSSPFTIAFRLKLNNVKGGLLRFGDLFNFVYDGRLIATFDEMSVQFPYTESGDFDHVGIFYEDSGIFGILVNSNVYVLNHNIQMASTTDTLTIGLEKTQVKHLGIWSKILNFTEIRRLYEESEYPYTNVSQQDTVSFTDAFVTNRKQGALSDNVRFEDTFRSNYNKLTDVIAFVDSYVTNVKPLESFSDVIELIDAFSAYGPHQVEVSDVLTFLDTFISSTKSPMFSDTITFEDTFSGYGPHSTNILDNLTFMEDYVRIAGLLSGSFQDTLHLSGRFNVVKLSEVEETLSFTDVFKVVLAGVFVDTLGFTDSYSGLKSKIFQDTLKFTDGFVKGGVVNKSYSDVLVLSDNFKGFR